MMSDIMTASEINHLEKDGFIELYRLVVIEAWARMAKK